MADREPRTGFGRVLQSLAQPEVFASTILPLAGIAEAAVSRGRSPGTAALTQQDIIFKSLERQRAEKEREAETKFKAQERALATKRETPLTNAELQPLGLDEQSQSGIIKLSERSPDLANSLLSALVKEQTTAKKFQLTDQELESISDPAVKEFAQRFPKKWRDKQSKTLLFDEDQFIKEQRLKAEAFKELRGDPKIALQVKREDDLAKRYEGKAKDYEKVRDAYTRVEASAKNPSAAGDLALVFNYMKILDPGSVVRESEFANAQHSAGIPDRILAVRNQILSGTRLAPAQRADFLDRAQRLYTEQLSIQNQTKEQFQSIASQRGLDAGLVTGGVFLKPVQTLGKQVDKVGLAKRALQEGSGATIEQQQKARQILEEAGEL